MVRFLLRSGSPQPRNLGLKVLAILTTKPSVYEG